jgi:hypothetical protein
MELQFSGISGLPDELLHRILVRLGPGRWRPDGLDQLVQGVSRP